MNVKELIEVLKTHHEELEVCIVCSNPECTNLAAHLVVLGDGDVVLFNLIPEEECCDVQ